ncbi:uncharacterized protein LOC107882334 [Acyrthosiphon pisum]|uniref:Uncharacterized protein n=1 Tax=Acyrthosiphon pisum TaxID=7029 RepID=A0A8R2NM00_ACYPI|nr:uncharacterized protein LOC107882334 [Acyrthosiphon pisum]
MNETKLQKIKNNIINKSPLNIEQMKKKINNIHYILNQLTIQNFQIPASDLPNCYNNNIISYKKQINSLTQYLKNCSFPHNLKNYSNQLLTPATTPANQSTRQTREIEDTPVRIKQNVKTFYKRSIRTDVLSNLRLFSTLTQSLSSSMTKQHAVTNSSTTIKNKML